MSAGLSNNREVKLIRHVQGEIHPEDFAIMETTIPAPGPYEAVVRNRWFRVSISTRLMAQEDAKPPKAFRSRLSTPETLWRTARSEKWSRPDRAAAFL